MAVEQLGIVGRIVRHCVDCNDVTMTRRDDIQGPVHYRLHICRSTKGNQGFLHGLCGNLVERREMSDTDIPTHRFQQYPSVMWSMLFHDRLNRYPSPHSLRCDVLLTRYMTPKGLEKTNRIPNLSPIPPKSLAKSNQRKRHSLISPRQPEIPSPVRLSAETIERPPLSLERVNDVERCD